MSISLQALIRKHCFCNVGLMICREEQKAVFCGQLLLSDVLRATLLVQH